jgi:hypothetical protein
MNKKLALLAVLVLSTGLITNVYAHKAQVVGNYKIEVGWKNEPPVVGKENAIEITVTKATSADKKTGQEHSHKSEKTKTTKTAYDGISSEIHLVSSNKNTAKHDEKSHTHAKKSSGISGLEKTLEADITLNGKKTFLKLAEDKKKKGTYYGPFTPDSEGFPTVHIVGKIKTTPIELTFHPEKVEPKK